MVYLTEKTVNNKKYFYLAHSVKKDGKIKKFQIYIGSKKPSKEKILEYSKLLKRRMEDFVKKNDKLSTLISIKDVEELEKVKEWYVNLSHQSPAIRENYYEWFITTYTYNSNAIEGSELSLKETGMVLFEGVSPPNRPLRDVLAAENHKKAYDWLVAYKGDVNKKMILKLHKILSKDILNDYESGKFRQVQVYIRGSSDIPSRADTVEKEINDLVRWYKFNKRKYHPVVAAAYMHINFERTHPFVDFNGRTGRLLMNFILMKNNLPPVDIRNKDRMKYYETIKSGIHENLNPFIKMIIKYLKEIKNNS